MTHPLVFDLDDGCLGYSHFTGFKAVRSPYYLSGLPLKGSCGRKSILVEKDIPPDVDAGFLTVTDTNPLDTESYGCIPLPNLLHTTFFSDPFFHTQSRARSISPSKRPGRRPTPSHRALLPPSAVFTRRPPRTAPGSHYTTPACQTTPKAQTADEMGKVRTCKGYTVSATR
jgi:hypothetical protein